MKKLTLTQDAYICGHDGAFLRKRDKNGKALATGVWGAWYTAQAVDSEGNAYQVYWSLDGETGDCDFDTPYMVLDSDSRDVKDDVDVIAKS